LNPEVEQLHIFNSPVSSNQPAKYHFHDKTVYEFCSSLVNLLMIVIKSRSVRWSGYVVFMEKYEVN